MISDRDFGEAEILDRAAEILDRRVTPRNLRGAVALETVLKLLRRIASDIRTGRR